MSICEFESASMVYWCPEPIYITPIEWFQRERLKLIKEIVSLRYLWKPFELTVRTVHWVTRKTDPRWGRGRWRAKT